jgi:hypothetical protein
MMIDLAEQLWGAAQLMLNPRFVIDKFLDWIEELSVAMAPAQINGLVYREVRIRKRPDSLGA